MSDLSNELYELIRPKIDDQSYVLHNSSKFVSTGVISSLSLIDLIVEIEDKYNIQFSPEELTTHNFDSINSLSTLLRTKGVAV